jgi:rhomboid protease GluP
MFKRQKVGSVICPSCGKLVGVRDESCWNCGRRNPGLWGFAQLFRNFRGALDFENTVIWGCAALYLATLLVDPGGVRLVEGGMSFLAPGFPALLRFGASGAIPVFGYGRWWTVLSAGWLHANLLHIVFNMMWVRQIAPATAELYGTARAIIIYTVASISGFLLSSAAAFFPIPLLHGAAFTLGASAPIFGLFGALVSYGRRTGSSHIGSQAMTYAAILFLFGFIMPGVDNFAHLGGFLGGYAAATVLNPLHPEKGSHFLGAVLCFAFTGLAILASLLQGVLF